MAFIQFSKDQQGEEQFYRPTRNRFKVKDIKLGFAGEICISELKKKDSVANQQMASVKNGVLAFTKLTVLKNTFTKFLRFCCCQRCFCF